MVDISHEIRIKAPPDRVFAALSTVEGLRAWHSAHVSGEARVGGVLHIEGSGKPSFEWRVTELSPPHRVGWVCAAGPGDSVGTTAVFELAPAEEGHHGCVHPCRLAGNAR